MLFLPSASHGRGGWLSPRGPVYGDGSPDLYVYSPCDDRWYKTRITSSSCKTEGSNRFQRLRRQILHWSIKKNQKVLLKTKKVGADQSSKFFGRTFLKFRKFRKFSLKFVWKWKILRSKIFEIFDLKNFHRKLNENFRDRKFSIFSISKIFNIFEKCL